MASKEIKETIRDFVNFDIENDYYKDDEKVELAKKFKDILFYDDATVRQFLKSLLSNFREVARDYYLVAKEGGVIEEPDEPEDAVEEPEDSIEEPLSTEESFKRIVRKSAADILYE